jgi:taurine dioxygenase
MHLTVLEPLGVEITDLAPADLDAGAVPELKSLLSEHGVAVLRGQDMDDHAFLAFLKRFGDPVFTEGETPVPGFPDLNVVSNVGRSTVPRSVFHVDTSYVRRPPAFTALRAVTIPTQGGQTLFTNQYRAFEILPSTVRARLHGRTIRHVVTGVAPGEGSETSAEHPALRTHPLSGRTALYLSTPERCVSISGMEADESREMIEFLYRHSTADHNVYRHSWAVGDVVIWDNRCVLHRADHADVVGDRIMHRGMVAVPA